MRREFLLIDAYNIIHAWSDLKELARDVSLDSARQKLLDLLSNYRGTKNQTIIVVFDGYLVKGNIGEVKVYNGLNIVYTKEAETADHYIERVVTSLPKHYYIKVATGDSMEQLIIHGQGALRMTARELRSEIEHENRSIRKNYTEKRPVKNIVLGDFMDEETTDWIEKLRRQK